MKDKQLVVGRVLGQAISGGTSTLKLKLSVARKFRADNIFIPTHTTDACVA